MPIARAFSPTADPVRKVKFQDERPQIAAENERWFREFMTIDMIERIRKHSGISPRLCLGVANNGIMITTPWIVTGFKRIYSTQHIPFSDPNLKTKIISFLKRLREFVVTRADWPQITVILEEVK